MHCIYKADNLALKQKGIYKISFGEYGSYIGQTKQSFKKRWNAHKRSFKNFNCNQNILCLCDMDIEVEFSIVRILDDDFNQWESCYINCLYKPNLNVQHPKCYGNNPRCA